MTAASVGIGDQEDGVDRDTWCTPLWLARAVGEWDVDACTNARSHIRARVGFDLHGNPRRRDGLVMARFLSPNTRVWCNPPYSRHQVIRWIEAYRRTRFCFLVRFDSSTDWFSKLWSASAVVCVPAQRINFEPPPGEEGGSNPYPHGLFYRDERDVTPTVRELCYVMKPNR